MAMEPQAPDIGAHHGAHLAKRKKKHQGSRDPNGGFPVRRPKPGDQKEDQAEPPPPPKKKKWIPFGVALRELENRGSQSTRSSQGYKVGSGTGAQKGKRVSSRAAGSLHTKVSKPLRGIIVGFFQNVQGAQFGDQHWVCLSQMLGLLSGNPWLNLCLQFWSVNTKVPYSPLLVA